MSLLEKIIGSKITKENLAENCNITFDGFGGLNINNMVASEFQYIINYLISTEEKIIEHIGLRDEDDFKNIINNFTLLIRAIENELDKTILREEEAFNISHETALYNINNLKSILLSIYKYEILKKFHNLD